MAPIAAPAKIFFLETRGCHDIQYLQPPGFKKEVGERPNSEGACGCTKHRISNRGQYGMHRLGPPKWFLYAMNKQFTKNFSKKLQEQFPKYSKDESQYLKNDFGDDLHGLGG
jgi:hypothetical protein